MQFIRGLQSEWLKTKRSASSWIILAGGLFIPLIHLITSLRDHRSINIIKSGDNPNIWEQHFAMLWGSMMSLILPMTIILASSLITQMEYRNNTWKQVYTTPQSYATIFFSKFSVILLLTVKFFIYFNIGILLSGIIPCLLFDHQFPKQDISIMFFLTRNLVFFISCLPMLAIQYLMGLKYKNSLVSIGVGIIALIASLMVRKWKYSLISPYVYIEANFMPDKKEFINIYVLSIVYFLIIMTISYMLYISKKEKG